MSTTATTTTVMRPPPSSSTTTTVLENLTRQQQQTLTLRLNRPKKKVSWKEGTVDNEYMQKKSSKICCIFHKEKPFDEDDSDDDCNHDHKSDGACSSSQNNGGLFDKQASIYVDARPRYPREWFSMLAALTPHHCLAWDVGTGNGQAAVGVSEHYKQVIATDISEEQLKHARPHPQIRYLHTPLTMSDDELVTLLGGENSVDLITVASAVHWFDLEKFYPIVRRVLRNPGGILAVWCYSGIQLSPEIDLLLRTHSERTFPFRNPNVKYAVECYKTLPFPFESVGVGSEGQPLELEMQKEMSFEGLLKLLKSLSSFNTAKGQGVDLLSEEVVREFESAWGGPELVRTISIRHICLQGKLSSE